jgi:DNA-binding transcriptional regulator GbsR (MarR family)
MGYASFETFQTESSMAKRSPKSLPPEKAQNASDLQQIKTNFIHDYGLGYQSFGLPKMMGQVVGLLLFHAEPISLDDITEELQVSKGPVSQVMRRLRDHNLVRRAWVSGSRRDHYEVVPDIFGQAFANHAALQNENLALARKYTQLIRSDETELPESFAERIKEMDRFYTLMNKHLANFLEEWQASRPK